METNILFQKETYWKYLAIEVNNKTYGISNMIFYNENGIICKYDRVRKPKFEYFTFKGNTVRKLKEPNYKKFKDNFIIKNHDDFYDLYIYVENVDLIYHGYKRVGTSLYKFYTVNNIDFKIYYKKIDNSIYEYRENIDNLISNIKDYIIGETIGGCSEKGFDYKDCLTEIENAIEILDSETNRVCSLNNEFTL